MGGFRKTKKHHTEREWGCLTDLKKYIENFEKKEKVKEFNGHTLTTSKGVYQLGPDGLQFYVGGIMPEIVRTLYPKVKLKPIKKKKKVDDSDEITVFGDVAPPPKKVIKRKGIKRKPKTVDKKKKK